MAKHILIVDDEPLIVKGLKFSLEQEGYLTDAAYDGTSALKMANENDYDLILLDLMLPGVDGMSVCQQVRETSNVPIIMITAKGEDMDRILGLEYGADDYLTKPFNILEVKARMKTLFRRIDSITPKASASQICVHDMLVNFDNRTVTVNEKEVNLTAKEFDLLQLFINNRGKVYSRQQLLDTVWKFDYLGEYRTVDVHIRRLREKIEPNPGQPEYILTKWGVGYYFTEK
ncbi:MAG: response regulator transcription factor [Clostridiales bacterium]|nr:response regulator transcription factor [Clostridiales bacterium]